MAQQQPVLPPLPGGQSGLGLEHRVFRPITEEESRLHVHEEEDEEDQDETECAKLEAEARQSPWMSSTEESAWQCLPVTLGECKLTDSKISLSRLSPLLQMSHMQASMSSSSKDPYHWDQNLHLPQSATAQQENMDTTSGT